MASQCCSHEANRPLHICRTIRTQGYVQRVPTAALFFTAGVHKIRVHLADFDVLLTVHLSIFILVVKQIDAQNLFYSKFISCLYMFRAPCAHRQKIKIVLYSLWYHHIYRWPSRAQSSLNLYTGQPPTGVMIPEAV